MGAGPLADAARGGGGGGGDPAPLSPLVAQPGQVSAGSDGGGLDVSPMVGPVAVGSADVSATVGSAGSDGGGLDGSPAVGSLSAS
jgi:hypothetical protein